MKINKLTTVMVAVVTVTAVAANAALTKPEGLVVYKDWNFDGDGAVGGTVDSGASATDWVNNSWTSVQDDGGFTNLTAAFSNNVNLFVDTLAGTLTYEGPGTSSSKMYLDLGGARSSGFFEMRTMAEAIGGGTGLFSAKFTGRDSNGVDLFVLNLRKNTEIRWLTVNDNRDLSGETVNAFNNYQIGWENGKVSLFWDDDANSGANAKTYLDENYIGNSLEGVAEIEFEVTTSGENGKATIDSMSVEVPDPNSAASVSMDATNTVYVGEAFTLSTFVGGATPIHHQWYKGGSLLSGETNAAYSSTNAVLADAGEWSITVSNALGTASATTEVVVVDSPAIVYWDNESADGLVNAVSNWNPNFLPSLSIGVPGVVTNLGGGTTELVAPAINSLDDMNITFEDGTSLTFPADSVMNSGSLLFKGSSVLDKANKYFHIGSGSSLVISNTTQNFAELIELQGADNVMTVANSASIDLRRSWRVASGASDNTLNWFSTGTLNTGLDAGHAGNDGVRLDRASGNVINISSGKISTDENGFTVTSGNYINFPADSTGILEARGVDFSSSFTDMVTNGLIRTEEIVATNLSVFVINYDGTDTTMTWTGEIIVIVNEIQFSEIGYVAASNGMVLAWTTDPADAGLDVYRTLDLVTPTWNLIATDVVNSYTDTAITNQAFYQLVPVGETFP